MRRILAVVAGLAVAATGLMSGTPAASPASAATAIEYAGSGTGGRLVVDWNAELLRILRTPGAQPATVHPTRSMALLHAAINDAVVSAGHRGHAYLARVPAPASASPVAAAAKAGHDTLAALYPSRAAELDTQLAGELATVPARGRASGEAVGGRVARLLLAARADDGSLATPPPYVTTGAPGDYRPTPPAFAAPVFTHWAAVTPFVPGRAVRFRPAPYPALTSPGYAAAVNEVKLLGRDTSTARTADQATQARFWAAPIQNYWNEIAQAAVLRHHTGLSGAAALFAQLDLAVADSVIAFYDGKYADRIWRPVTAIRLAGTDGNPATVADPAWNPLAGTPADPSYPGAHSVVSEAAATVLAHRYGPRDAFTVTSEALPGGTRSFDGYAAAAGEAGLSRIYAGVHTRLDHEAGRRLGGAVAGFTLQHALTR